MRKTLILIVVIVILVIIAIWLSSRRPQSSCVGRSSTSFKGVKKDDSNSPNAKVNMILSGESKMLSYSIVLKNLTEDVESVHFNSKGQDVFQASGPRSLAEEGSEVVVHGLWREKSRVPITSEHIKELVDGNMIAIVRFKNSKTAPFRVEMKPTP